MRIHKDIYQLLGLSEKSTSSLVKKMFREFAKRNHPDFFPEDKEREEKFKIVTSAYQNWKNIQSTLAEMSRIKNNSSAEFQPWAFKYAARKYQEVMV
jgi:hypothetical protein